MFKENLPVAIGQGYFGADTVSHIAGPTEHHKLQSSSAPPDCRRYAGPPIIATAIEVRSSPDPGLDTPDLDPEGQIRPFPILHHRRRPAFRVGTRGKPRSSPTHSPHSRCRRAPQSPDPTGDTLDLDLGRSDPVVPLAACPREGGGHWRRTWRRRNQAQAQCLPRSLKPGEEEREEGERKREGEKREGEEEEEEAAPPLPACGGVAGGSEAGEAQRGWS
ncbi:hypothetical protein OsI_01924 [Oryza sativa Indica Group]|uniref:Uncharacterized protein n=1 Tax=Oryza sativa subsp. indica TaxID=39946 RepID=B8A869_ORYSI|nr:hypothetical protein OsI_01924 [Oryza sativa Indica Group]